MKYRYYLLTFLVTGITWLSSVMPVSADEKNMKVSLPKDYKQAIFNFEFEDEQAYNVSITTPTGDVTNQVIDGMSGGVVVDNVVKGEYNISIAAEGNIECRASVECKKNAVQEVSNNVSVTSSLTDIKIYFVDGDLCVTWKDTGVGNVNVVVTNPNTMRKLANTTVTGTQFRTAISSDVKEVEVYLVPASSAKIEGSGVKYTVEVVRNVEGTINFPENAIVNSDYYDTTVNVPDDTTVYVRNNGEAVFKEYYKEKGEYEISIPLNETNNELEGYVVDANNNMVTFRTSVVKDLIAPQVKFNQTYDNTVTTENNILLSGKCTDAETLYINGTSIQMDEYGRFSFTEYLEMGENSILVCVVDEAGNEFNTDILVKREKSKTPFYFFIGMFILAIVGGATACVKISKHSLKEDINEVEIPEPKVMEEKKKEQKTVLKSSVLGRRMVREMNRRKVFAELVSSTLFMASVFIFFVFIVKNTIVASGSMEPTLMTGDCVIFNQLAYKFTDVQRGDIICYWSEEHGKPFSKRVIGTAGDKIEFHDGYVFINGMRADESAYIPEGMETNCTKSFEVPEGCVFVLGDNRENSVDSRFFEQPYIETEDIYGKYIGSFPNIFNFF